MLLNALLPGCPMTCCLLALVTEDFTAVPAQKLSPEITVWDCVYITMAVMTPLPHD